MARQKYLNNRDLLRQIHLSKNTYCSFVDDYFKDYDIILPSIDRINIRTIAEAKRNRADRLQKNQFHIAKKAGETVKLSDFELLNWKKIPKQDVVFRVHTFDHIPEEPGRKKNPKSVADRHVRLYFPPFAHYSFNDDNELIMVGKSHWEGGMDNGYFKEDRGRMTDELGRMFMKLCERYGSRYNWRGYCVDEKTEALTQRGWLGINEITDHDTILSYTDNKLTWSSIKSIFRDDFDGKMFKMTVRGMDALVTPRHKFITDSGLKEVEYILEKDKIILTGEPVEDGESIHSDAFVELIGWIVTEGNFYNDKSRNYTRISVYQNEGTHADRIRECLHSLNAGFSESILDKLISFTLNKDICNKVNDVITDKVLPMDFILSLTQKQRSLLIDTMIDGDGWIRSGNMKSYCQKDKKHVDSFLALCTIAGIRTTHKLNEITSFGKPTTIFNVNLLSEKKNVTRMENVNLYEGKRSGSGRSKVHHPNEPTVDYHGKVWCPETEYGSFMARRNGTIYLTGNTYNDEMQQQALMQLSQVGLQFDESKSQNPFAYYTAIINASFTRVLNIEKRGQNIRDDILEMNGLTPSYTRQALAQPDQWQAATDITKAGNKPKKK